ncbi:response regulator [Halalkalibacter urbisdiaboli]|uniref:response regulator n=1 Tax=Halalkalibacter urbisdiaboli TaxID=1960589 RepID=UPI000B4378B6|nr:response regulator [Halalkalibacter urbisdiaboli]
MKSVLIIDDDQEIRNGLINHVPWRKLNLTVKDTACDGLEALKKIRLSPPDILITDIYMPKMTGLELIKRLYEEFPDIHIVIHSGYDHFENAREAIRYGVKHFFLKPSPIQEIETVLLDISQEIDIQEKQKTLIKNYETQRNEYLRYTKDALVRELLNTRYKASDIPSEKLALLNLSKEQNVIVSTLTVIRPPYLTKAHERDWQLMKFSAGNIILEMIETHERFSEVDIHVVDYSDSTFVLVFFENENTSHLRDVSYELSSELMRTILFFLKLSIVVGIGRMKTGVHEIIDSYLESQRALEAAEYQEFNRVYTFEEVQEQSEVECSYYPFELLKDIHEAILLKDYEGLVNIWGCFVKTIETEKNMSLYIVQTICISTLNAILMNSHSKEQLMNETLDMSQLLTKVYSQRTIRELTSWMGERIDTWVGQTKEELNGKKSHKLIVAVKDYVKENYDQEITLAEIADTLYVNRNYLSQLFKKVTGETFVTYLNRFRIEKAKERLREKKYMVYEVSEMVGYQNSTYFSQVFKSVTGMSPSEFY